MQLSTTASRRASLLQVEREDAAGLLDLRGAERQSCAWPPALLGQNEHCFVDWALAGQA